MSTAQRARRKRIAPVGRFAQVQALRDTNLAVEPDGGPMQIDKSFVMAMTRDDSDQIMVRSTINLAHELGLQVVAEGVEDQETLELLRALECDYAQGYHISKPISTDGFIEMVSGGPARRQVA